jgi:hypothetical protein
MGWATQTGSFSSFAPKSRRSGLSNTPENPLSTLETQNADAFYVIVRIL